MEYVIIILWVQATLNVLYTIKSVVTLNKKLNYFEKNIPIEYMKYINKEIGFCDDRRGIMEDHVLKEIKVLKGIIQHLNFMNLDLKSMVKNQQTRIEMLEKKSNLADRLKVWRRSNNITLKEAERITSISKSQLSNIERGMRPSKDDEGILLKVIGK